ncbi:uncharacterized protein A4U43_C04F25310 [Asparagus officinalis]|uniref:Uncharacterized protein n=1 Tax=Asparagus officinalis TaxID=4686 RepID=A0A5P1F499_ASPOF|nr:uncharacterized protein A4U43_C04F25310 [Asparagus officinalis]
MQEHNMYYSFEWKCNIVGLPPSSSKTPISLIRTSSEAQKAWWKEILLSKILLLILPILKFSRSLWKSPSRGVPIKITRVSWTLLSAAIPELVDNPKVAPFSSKAPPPAVISSSSDSLEGASSSAPLQAFEHVKKSSKKKSSKRMLAHLPHRKHLTIMKRSFSPGSKGKSPSSFSSLPISSNSLDKLHDIVINCGIQDPINLEGLSDIQAMEKEGSTPSP